MTSNRISANDFRLFNRQLVSLIKTDLPLSRALAMLSKEVRKPGLRNAIQDLQKSVEAGQSLARAVAGRPKTFPKLYAKIIEAGEKSNNLVGVLAQFVKHSETMAEMKERLKDVLMYPAIVLISCLVMVSALVLFVLPVTTHWALSLIQRANEGELSYRGGQFWSQAHLFLARHMPFIVIGFFGLVALLVVVWLALRVTERGRAVLDRIKLRSPIYGKCYRLSLLTRFCETLGLLIRSDVPVGDALYLTGQCSPSATMRRTCARVQRAVEAGRKMSDAMSSERILGPMLTFMVSVGEKQEAPHEELHSAAEIFGSNLHNRARRAAYWVDAIVLVFVALLVILCSRLLFQPLIFLIRSMTGVE